MQQVQGRQRLQLPTVVIGAGVVFAQQDHVLRSCITKGVGCGNCNSAAVVKVMPTARNQAALRC